MLSKYLELLDEIVKSLTKTLKLEDSLKEILASLYHFIGMNRGTIYLNDSLSKTVSIAASVGLTKKEVVRGIYKIGEGITGYVIQTGKPLVIPQVAKDSRFLNRTKSRKNRDNLSFICVPVKEKGRVIGALSADREYKKNHNLNNDLQLLTITATIVSHILNMYNLRELDRSNLIKENQVLRSELQDKFKFSDIIGHSSPILEVLKLLSQVTQSNATVLIRGESGTGKELIANAIHYNSKRASKPFIKVNCAAIPDSLLESELFGFEKGAFTGASFSKPGKFEEAHGGTIFLDEIGDFPLSTQVKLLRVLQSKEVERLGGNKIRKLDIRVITATNRDLEQDMKDGRFREDLYYRINIFPIFLPPLRERKTDILLFAEYFLEKFSRENNKKIKSITTPAIDMLMSYHWPGNVRELENCMERAVLVCSTASLTGNDLPPTLQFSDLKKGLSFTSMNDAVANLEREMIIESLKRNHGSQRKSAKELDVTERVLGYKIKKYNIYPDIYTSK